MLVNLLVGGIVAFVLIVALRKTIQDVKSNKCSGCGGCSKKSLCNKIEKII